MSIRPLKVTGWLALALAVVVATFVLVAIGRGYSYDFRSGRLKLNGLVIISSTPSGADISIDGKTSRHRTPYRTTLESGDYTLDVTKTGFRPWTKHISISPSEVTWEQYILLLPTKLDSATWSNPASMTQLTTSRDHRHFAYVDATSGIVWTFDTGNHKPTKLYTPAAPVAGQPVEVVAGLQWSGDANKLLVTTTVAGQTYQRLVTVSNGTVAPLSEQFGTNLAGLQFNPTNSRQLVWLAPEGLRRLDTDSQTVSAVLADKVAAYTFGGNNQIIYVQSTTLGKSLYRMDFAGGNKHQLVQSLADSPSYVIDFASYQGGDEIAVLPASTRTVTLYSDLDTTNPTSKVIASAADDLLFNADGRFLLYRDDKRLASYDLELKRTYKFTPSDTPYQTLVWFDTYHILASNGTAVSLLEFDGANASTLTNKFAPGQVSYTSNQHEVLVAQPQANGTVNLTALTIKP